MTMRTNEKCVFIGLVTCARRMLFVHQVDEKGLVDQA